IVNRKKSVKEAKLFIPTKECHSSYIRDSQIQSFGCSGIGNDIKSSYIFGHLSLHGDKNTLINATLLGFGLNISGGSNKITDSTFDDYTQCSIGSGNHIFKSRIKSLNMRDDNKISNSTVD